MYEYTSNRLIEIAKIIDDCIKEKNITRQEFAGIMGVQPSTITKWLSGSHNFTAETLIGIEFKLGVAVFVTSIDEIEKINRERFNEWLNKAYTTIEELKKFSLNKSK
jgi:transcriptional regulator with XRE-family HTH domain